MSAVVWLVEDTWPAAVDAARAHAPATGEVVLLHVTDPGPPAAAHGAYAGLLGRGDADPGDALEELAEGHAERLLQAAADRLGRPCRTARLAGRVEREVVRAAVGAELLVLARDGERDRLGPHSLGPAARFVVDHAPCPVLLVWPGPAPEAATLPPPPPD
ncbi:universal stress protein [Streptomyces sedi]|uniref:Universal stress protein n=1 Tax=Streptomyces sedi TaxID=555059 RepID=A0A5C4V4T7_9ACTN|nr:universal stress protein [Streptomyces sedi]TNM30992.1 universal stress protein [Streptomyces sedi]